MVEDDGDIAGLLDIHLRDLGCEVDLAEDGLVGWKQASSDNYDLVILDLMLPGMDGLELCRRLRAEAHYTPILMLTARSSEMDRVVGLEIGADDYLTKPFSIRELQARVKALFRRMEALREQSPPVSESIRFADLEIDVVKRRVTIRQKPVDLTAKEYALLLQFSRNPGRVYTRSQLLDLVWGYGHEGYEHTVNSHINRLRIKIEKIPAKPFYILTVWGIGYKFTS